MTMQTELLKLTDNLPPRYFGELIDFAGYLQQKAKQESSFTASSIMYTDSPNNEPPLKCLIGVKTPRADRLLGAAAKVGDISYEELREERLMKKYGESIE